MLVAAIIAGCEDSDSPENFNNPAPASALQIIPASVTIGPTNTFAVFEARGGTAPYSWHIGDANLGTIPDSTAHLITYTRTAAAFGAHAIAVEDANGWQATAEIWQPNTTNTVSTP